LRKSITGLHVDFVESSEDRGGRLRLQQALGDARAASRDIGTRCSGRSARICSTLTGAGDEAKGLAAAGAPAQAVFCSEHNRPW